MHLAHLASRSSFTKTLSFNKDKVCGRRFKKADVNSLTPTEVGGVRPDPLSSKQVTFLGNYHLNGLK